MRIIGLGVDLVDIRRIENLLNRFGSRFEQRILAPAEREVAMKINHKASFIAKRFAAKEACAKALGTGFSRGIGFADMIVSKESSGKPIMCLYGNAKKILQELTPNHSQAEILISLTDDYPYAYAQVIIQSMDS